MTLLPSTSLEKESLEAHVDLCAMRYSQLDSRLTIIEKKVNDLQAIIEDSKNSMAKVIIGSAGTIVVAIIGLIATLLTK